MLRKLCKKIVIITLCIMLLMVLYKTNKSFGVSDPAKDVAWQSWTPGGEGDAEFLEKLKIIPNIIRTIGIVVSVVSLMFIGIKVMLGSIEEKANYKKKMKPWIIGATMVFAITFIPTTIYDITNSLLWREEDTSSQDTGTVVYWEQYIKGYDDAIKEAKEIYVEEITNHDYDLLAKGNAQALSKLRNSYMDRIEVMRGKIEESKAYYVGYKEAIEKMEYDESAWSWWFGNDKAKKYGATKENIYEKIYINNEIIELNILPEIINYFSDNPENWDKTKYESMNRRLELQISLWEAEAEEKGEASGIVEELTSTYKENWTKGYDEAIKKGYEAFKSVTAYQKLKMEAEYENKFNKDIILYRTGAYVVGYKKGIDNMMNAIYPEAVYEGNVYATNAISGGEEKIKEAKEEAERLKSTWYAEDIEKGNAIIERLSH